MAWRFFRKSEPKNSPVLGNGSKATFTTLDHVTGYHGTENQYVQDELVRLINEGRYGLTEISDVEFHSEYVEPKKKLGAKPLPKLWREEIAPRQFSTDTLTPSVPKPSAAVAAAVEGEHHDRLAAQATPVTVADTVAVQSSPPTEFKPQVVKRSKQKPKQQAA